MTTKTATATVMGRPGEPIDDAARKNIEETIGRMLDGEDIHPQARASALAKLNALFAESGETLEGLSAASISKSLEATADGLEGVANGIVALGFSLSRQGKLRQTFEMGEASGMLSACRALMGTIADRIAHAVKCDCHKEESESETIPPPAPGPEGAA